MSLLLILIRLATFCSPFCFQNKCKDACKNRPGFFRHIRSYFLYRQYISYRFIVHYRNTVFFRNIQQSVCNAPFRRCGDKRSRSEEHTSEPSHQIISYAVFCLKKKKKRKDVNRNADESRADGGRTDVNKST